MIMCVFTFVVMETTFSVVYFHSVFVQSLQTLMPMSLSVVISLMGRLSLWHHNSLANFGLFLMQYIRPGAAPLPGGPAAGTACPPGAARPPLISGPVSGGGRGDWRPAGGRGIPNGPKGYTGFGFPAWANSSSRAFGSGLDFTLPAHK